jgi:hypothetical protein
MSSTSEAEEHTERRLDEETPLLADQHGAGNGTTGGVDSGGEQTVVAEEPSNKRLVVVLGSIYVGVFLGALG